MVSQYESFRGIQAHFIIEKKETLKIFGNKPWVEESYGVNVSLIEEKYQEDACHNFRVQCTGQGIKSNQIRLQISPSQIVGNNINSPEGISMKRLIALDKSNLLPHYQIPFQMLICNPDQLTFPIMNIYLKRWVMFKMLKQERTMDKTLDSIEMGDLTARHDFIKVGGTLNVPKSDFLPGNMLVQYSVEFDIFIGSGDCLENPENSVDNLKGKFNIVILTCGEDAGHSKPMPIPPAPPNYSQLSSRATSYETLPPNYEDIEEDEMHAK